MISLNLSNQPIRINLNQFHLVGMRIHLVLAQLGTVLLNQCLVHGRIAHQALLTLGLIVHQVLVLTLAGMTDEVITINHRISFIR